MSTRLAEQLADTGAMRGIVDREQLVDALVLAFRELEHGMHPGGIEHSIAIADVRRLAYRPGDTIVFKVRGRLTAQAADRLKARFDQMLPFARILLQDDGLESIEVLTVDDRIDPCLKCDDGGRCCPEHKRHVSPHLGCILR